MVLPEPCSPTTITPVGGFGFIVSLPAVATEGGDQLVVDDLDDLLGRREALGQLGPGRLLLDPADEALDDLEVDVGLEEGEADLPGHLVDLLVPQAAAAADAGVEIVFVPVRE